VAIEHATLHSYVGGWPEYARVREERKARGEDPSATGQRPAAGAGTGAGRGAGARATADATRVDDRHRTGTVRGVGSGRA
jgi:ATP-binding cassette subfamily F protein 3